MIKLSICVMLWSLGILIGEALKWYAVKEVLRLLVAMWFK